MTCEHCVNAVTRELTAIAGVDGVEVSLVKDGASAVTITSGVPLSEAALRAAIASEGYEVVGMAEAKPTNGGCGCGGGATTGGCGGRGRRGQGIGLPIVPKG